jgi:hypothetical protein
MWPCKFSFVLTARGRNGSWERSPCSGWTAAAVQSLLVPISVPTMQISRRASTEPWAGPQEDGAEGIEVGVDLPDTVAVRATAVLDTTRPVDFISPTARNGCRHSLSSEMGAGRTSACCATGERRHGAAPLLPPSSWCNRGRGCHRGHPRGV